MNVQNQILADYGFGIVIVCIYGPMAWVRKIQYFNLGYAFGLVMIIFTTLFTCTYSLKEMGLNKQQAGFKPFNKSSFLDTIGFAFYAAFEGIGTLLPIMKETK